MLTRTLLITTGLTALATAQGASTDAPIVRNNPLGATYQAVVTATNKSTINGNIVVSTNPTHEGANVQVNLEGLPSTGGPFTWHIHKAPIPENGNCTAALTHLDPYGRGETPACDAANPASCEVGDQSGKWGKMGLNGTSYSANYIDPYLALLPTDPAFVGGKSIVIHYPNKTRIACANFVQVSGGTGNGTAPDTGSCPAPSLPVVGGNTGGTPSSTSSPPASTGAAAGGLVKGVMALVAGGLAFAL
ncbi:superoxide dismutase [Elsinoe ampelina]|uniref:superoxide dismutase n=1 Tax=Elsinoe ampelina TaxID=302913 RepID=A0A6A6GB71_9PEZI|nr:superoxide dismutase [Elsinoe ampelina]